MLDDDDGDDDDDVVDDDDVQDDDDGADDDDDDDEDANLHDVRLISLGDPFETGENQSLRFAVLTLNPKLSASQGHG